MSIGQVAWVNAHESEDALSILERRIRERTAAIGILGLGYVGLPLAVEFARSFPVIGFDPNQERVATITRGESHILDVGAARVRECVQERKLRATGNYADLADCDVVIICVPTPLEKSKDPDLSYIENAARSIAGHLRPGQLIVLESTTYPGTTDEFLLPLLSSGGLSLDRDFLLAFSPERVDPGNSDFDLTEITKVVGGCSARSTAAATELYASIMQTVHPVSSARAAETAKLLENTFRSVNIGLVNELALVCRQLRIDVNEVIDAAATKPFGFMPFYPGPGVGGHCIPLDPLYLSWRAKQQGFDSRFIRLADEVNSAMPGHVVGLIGDALNQFGKAINGSRVLLLGVAYKANVDDTRHSPAIPIIDRLREKGANVVFHDPFVSHLEIDLREWPEWRARDEVRPSERRRRLNDLSATSPSRRRSDPLTSVALTNAAIADADCVVIVTKHDGVDYRRIVEHARVIVDTRNALSAELRHSFNAKVIRL